MATGGGSNNAITPITSDKELKWKNYNYSLLDRLIETDSVLVKQEAFERRTYGRILQNNAYDIYDAKGKLIYQAKEDLHEIARNCLNDARPINIKLTVENGQEAVRIYRPFECFCDQVTRVYLPVEGVFDGGYNVGTIRKQTSMTKSKLYVKNAAGEKILRIVGPWNTFACCGNDIEFKVLDSYGSWCGSWWDSKNQVGSIIREWNYVGSHVLNDADIYEIMFPPNSSIEVKLSLLGAMFLIDYMWYD